MRFYPGWLFSLFLFFDNYEAICQRDSLAKTTQISAEAGALVTSGRMVPFWQRANQFGTVPLAGSFGTVRLGVSSDYRALPSRRVDWGYGLEVVGNVGGLNQQIVLPQAYIKARWRHIELYVGRRRNIIGLVDTLLTSGSYAMSGNALELHVSGLSSESIRYGRNLLSDNHC